MPSLRKRKSRTTTPNRSTTDPPPQSSDTRKEKVQSSLDTWVEPAPQNLAPSFEEHGLARHGVLETMAPLGVPPSSKITLKVRNLARALGKKRSTSVPEEEEETTPEMTPAPELEHDDSERMDEDDLQTAFPEQDEDEDDDYMPKTNPKKKQKSVNGAKTPVRGKAAAQSKTPSQGKTPVKNGVNKSTYSVMTPSVQHPGLQGFDQATTQRMQIAVNEACVLAKRDQRPEVFEAIQDAWTKGKEDPNMAKAMDGIIHQKADDEDWSTFSEFIRDAKRRFRKTFKRAQKEQKLRASKEAEAGNAYTTATNGEMPPTTKDEGHNNTNSELPLAVKNAPSKRVEPAEVSPHPLSTAPTFPPIEAPTPPTFETSIKSPRKQHATNGSAGAEPFTDNSAEGSSAAHTPAADAEAGSDSGLSDVDENILHHGPPPVTTRANTNGIMGASAAPKKTKNLQPRGGKKSRANSTKPPAKNKDRAPPTAEEVAEEAELRRRRKELLDQQKDIRAGMYTYAPVSEARFEDDETASMTDSIAAMGPPGDIARRRRPGRPPGRNGSTLQTSGVKRGRDNSSLSSPHPESVNNSRPSTPAALSVPSKRLKLNNGQAHQAARTKRSPVKNRDGPIAGIPHTGGGGSRQSGPDDNDPDSPPQESDDLCSACKGAGEFVCCDNCPRVFHFLCCDPPRLDAPTGSFLCHECTAKLKPSDDSPVESCLGPLFKSLESVNPRAFALPLDIQTHFENVAARPDGSYYEDIKKFPLAKSSGYGYQRPEYTKVLDTDHKPILCASCGLTSGGKRQMLKCDYCPSHWHLDCLDPPMANPPHINLESSTRDAWRCPRHIEHDFRSGYVAQNDLTETKDVVMVDASVTRPGRKVRKPRQPKVIEPTFSRGMRNNGLIEIINDQDDDTDGEGNYVFNNDEKDTASNVYRLPEKGIMLDFIDKVKSGRVKKAQKNTASNAQHRSSLKSFTARPIEQQQAALNLAKLANKEKDIGLHENNIDALVLSLTAEAPNDVVTAIKDAPPAPLSNAEREQLLRLQELIKIRLGDTTMT